VSSTPDILVVGGGPAGAATAYWLARSGASVLVAEKRGYPREKTCGDGLTPRAIRQLADMGFDFDIPELHRIVGLRAYVGERCLEMPWPRNRVYPDWGAVMRRSDLDLQVARLAETQGAVILQHTEAAPVMEAGRLVAVELRFKNGASAPDVEVVHPRWVAVADGSLSRFGRRLGARRRRDYPFGLALRGYYASPNSADGFIESQLDVRDEAGRSLPGYGWVFPLGDGEVNVGVGVVSTFRGWKDVGTSRLLDAYLASLPGHWEIGPRSETRAPVGGKLPMAMSVGPRFGNNWVAVGDAAGAVNPFNGEGIDYAYETARAAAGFLLEALATDDPGALVGYSRHIDATYADYHRVARLLVMAIGNPPVMRALTGLGIRSRPLMEWALKVMANLLDPDERGVSEWVYHLIERLVRFGPDPLIRR